MKPSLAASLTALALSIFAAPDPTADAQDATATSIPEIARIGKIQIGYSTQADLAKYWGEGKTIIGGHPNSGRLWRVKGTPWILHTDGFEYSKRGLVVDSLELSEDRKLENDVPYATPAKSDFAWLGAISPGMSKDEVMQILKRKSLPITPTQNGCETKAKGFSTLTSVKVPLQAWTTSFDFTNGSLSRLTLTAGN